MRERDALLICAAGFLRSATISLVGVTLAFHLSELGFTATQIGLVIGAGLAGASLATAIVGLRGDAWGRRRVLAVLAGLGAAGYVALAAVDHVAALLPLAFVGMINGMGRDRGAASALEQAILPATVPDERRTWALAWYNLALDAGHALGRSRGNDPDTPDAGGGDDAGGRTRGDVRPLRRDDAGVHPAAYGLLTRTSRDPTRIRAPRYARRWILAAEGRHEARAAVRP